MKLEQLIIEKFGESAKMDINQSVDLVEHHPEGLVVRPKRKAIKPKNQILAFLKKHLIRARVPEEVPEWKVNVLALSRSEEGKKLKEMLVEQMNEAPDEASSSGVSPRTPESEFGKSARLVRRHPVDAVLEAMRRAVKKGNAHPAFVKKQLLTVLDEQTPKFEFCTGGMTSIEINANGDYSRCSRLNTPAMHTGNVLDEKAIKLIDLNKEANCNVPCPRRMCFANNTIRASTRESFDQQIAEKGLRGDYRPERKDRKSDIFIRWKITEVCNYTCTYCTAWMTVNKKIRPEMSIDKIVETARVFTNQFDNISLRITGGEPAVKRNYVELMKYLHANLDKFVEIEIRTNFSYPEKQKEIFAMDWHGKLHYHIGCHIYDKNFKPWDFVDILSKPTSVDYIIKFVSTSTNQRYVDEFHRYFIDNGIDPSTMRIVYDVMEDVKDNAADDNTAVPPAIIKMVERGELSDDLVINLSQ